MGCDHIAPRGHHMVCPRRRWIVLWMWNIVCYPRAVEPAEPGTVVETDSHIVFLNSETAEAETQMHPDRMSWPLRKSLIGYGVNLPSSPSIIHYTFLSPLSQGRRRIDELLFNSLWEIIYGGKKKTTTTAWVGTSPIYFILDGHFILTRFKDNIHDK